MQDICRVTDTAEGTIFYHFKSKEHLLIAILGQIKTRILGEYETAFSGRHFTSGLDMDLGVIDDTGRQVAYIGPYPLLGIDYSGQDWFKQTARTGHCISDVFLGFRNAPHFIIAVRSELPDGHFFMAGRSPLATATSRRSTAAL